MSHDERVRKLLLPVGKFIMMQIRGRKDHGMIEMRLCKFIARNYWPFPCEDYTHLRVHEIYRNSIFLESQERRRALEAVERAQEENENKLRGGSSSTSDTEESQTLPLLEKQDRLTESPLQEDRKIPNPPPIPTSRGTTRVSGPSEVVDLLREFGYKGPMVISRRHPLEIEMERETDTGYKRMRSHRTRRNRKVYKASGRRLVNYGEDDQIADLAARPEVDNSSGLNINTPAPTNSLELTEEEFDAATAEAIRLSLQDQGHDMGPLEPPRRRESVLTVHPGDDTESDEIREIHLDGTYECRGQHPEDKMDIDCEKKKESRPRDESVPPPASPPKRRKLGSNKLTSWLQYLR
jgi:hypothetical protein